ncbi:phosphatase PAP2 family protein [Candidatus Saccharibacteria bacterium]|nr:phosphatase PAP2 family protein [Candidatus Saccharibacteria bacterium]
MQWDLITNIILATSIVTLAIFLCLGLYQWISRKSLKKVDPELLWIPLPLILMGITYVIFEYVVVLNTRPNGSGEPSFPSTHVMIVTTIFFLATMILPRYVKNKVLRVILEVIMVAMIGLTATGRVLANMHWPVDVIGGIAFAFIFTEVYYVTYKKFKKNRRRNAKRVY